MITIAQNVQKWIKYWFVNFRNYLVTPYDEKWGSECF